LIERMLQAQGYTTVSAPDGDEALARLSDETFDLVLLDIMMPVMDGLAVLAELRQAENTATLPVILISAMSDTEDVVRGLNMGANDYITKPIDMDIAQARIKTQLALKMLMDERNMTIQRLEESQQMREKFFHIASHDLKQPLTSLKIGAVLLNELIANADDTERALSVVDTMKGTIASMTEVVGEFLDSAALSSGKIDMKVTEVSARDLLWNIVTQFNPAAYEKQIRIQMEEPDVRVLCDPARFAQVLGNIVSNAIKYSPPESKIRISAQQEAEHLRILVADEGPGIPADERIHLFQPFGKLSTTPTGGESSHGLGLWIASHLIHLQDGDIGVESPPVGGSIFWVTVPLAPEPATTPE
ncbi:MAG: hybrid sensor histidine kinase/response regulator, partial [Chloroflexota bacterium]